MAEDSDQILFRRILVALDTSTHSLAALEAAAAMAQIMEANIKGIFVEDDDWRLLSRLSSVTEVNELTGDIKPFAEQTLEKQLKILENRIQRQLQFISRSKQIKHSWETAKGSVEEKILEAAKDTDLITIGRKGHSYGRHKKLGTTAKNIIQKSDKPVLILQEGLKLGDTIIAVYDGSRQSQRGIRLARALAEKNNGELFVLAIRNDPDAAEERNRELENSLKGASVKVNVKLLGQVNLWSFMQEVSNRRAGLLMIPKDQPFVQNHSLETLLGYIRCPLLLMDEN